MSTPADKSLRIRPGVPADLETLVEFQVAMAAETEGKALDRALLQRGIQGVFERPERGRYWLGERGEDGRAVGGLLVTIEWSDWRAAEFWWIQSVYVAPEARGTGVYRSLYEHVLAAARAAGACGLRLYVDHDNTGAQRVYERVGMQPSHYRFFEVDFVLGADAARPSEH